MQIYEVQGKSGGGGGEKVCLYIAMKWYYYYHSIDIVRSSRKTTQDHFPWSDDDDSYNSTLWYCEMTFLLNRMIIIIIYQCESSARIPSATSVPTINT